MEAQYLIDSYQKEFETTVESVNDSKFVVLENTIFYPNSGGQLNDTGRMIKEDGSEYLVVFVGKFDGKISHQIEADNKSELNPGDRVKCVIDWDRRYKLMRSHTAAHLVSGLISKKTGAKITGNQLDIEKVRIDFNLEEFDREALASYLDNANEMIDSDLRVLTYNMTREDVEANPEMVKLSIGLLPGIKVLRIVEIDGFDKQPDGGTHVKSLKEIGKLEFIKADNKGKNNRRLYFRLV